MRYHKPINIIIILQSYKIMVLQFLPTRPFILVVGKALVEESKTVLSYVSVSLILDDDSLLLHF